jgi:CRISPR-associated protein Cas2
MAADNRTTTMYVVAYDIAEDRRRTKVYKLLSGFGHWTQYSLFECYLTEKEYVRLRQMLDRHLRAGQDSVRFYPLCQACRKRVETVGSEKPQEPDLFLV